MSKISRKKILIKLIIIFVLAILSFCFGFKKCSYNKCLFVEDNSVDYKVYLKDNAYFETPYLEKNKTYITSLIDYIDTSYKYKVDFENEVSGKINYQIVAEIKADKVGNEIGNYWTKKYELTELETKEIKNKSECTINLQNKIEYNKYNETLNSFIEEYNLQAESILEVALVVTGNVKQDKNSEEIAISSEISLNMPLSQKAIEGKIVVENDCEKNMAQTQDKLAKLRDIFKPLFFIEVLIFCYYVFQYIQELKKKGSMMGYREKIKKITNDYDGIIIRVDNINIENYVRIDVKTVEDLINVYNNTREPINFWYSYEKSVFFIINNNTCYVYTIKKEGE
ncbi:MAG: hypothetical protein IJN50_06265 [Clostridia bacterium]|nr:hypothetical protein [Clostridia bacterium]